MPDLTPDPTRDLNFGIAPRLRRVYRRRNFCRMQSDQRPLRRAQRHDSYFAARKILLLVSNIFVSGKKNVEPSPLRFGKQIAVGKPVPSAAPCFDDGVADQIRDQWGWHAMVKENEHLGTRRSPAVREPVLQGCERRTARPRSPALSRCQTIP